MDRKMDRQKDGRTLDIRLYDKLYRLTSQQRPKNRPKQFKFTRMQDIMLHGLCTYTWRVQNLPTRMLLRKLYKIFFFSHIGKQCLSFGKGWPSKLKQNRTFTLTFN